MIHARVDSGQCQRKEMWYDPERAAVHNPRIVGSICPGLPPHPQKIIANSALLRREGWAACLDAVSLLPEPSDITRVDNTWPCCSVCCFVFLLILDLPVVELYPALTFHHGDLVFSGNRFLCCHRHFLVCMCLNYSDMEFLR